MRHADIIDALGIAPVAKRLNRHRTRVGYWRQHGIPRKHWPEVIQFAAEVGMPEVSFDALTRGESAGGKAAKLRPGRKPKGTGREMSAHFPPVSHEARRSGGNGPASAGERIVKADSAEAA